METILYDIANQKFLGKARKGFYLVDGKRPQLNNGIAELVITEQAQPTFNTETEKIEFTWVIDLNNGEYRKEYRVVALSVYEIAAKAWKHPEYSRKLIVDEFVAESGKGSKHFTRFNLKQNPMEYDELNNKIQIWIDGVDSKYQDELNSLLNEGLVTIETRPQILD